MSVGWGFCGVVEIGGLGFVVFHPFHDETVKRMGHPISLRGSRVGHSPFWAKKWAKSGLAELA